MNETTPGPTRRTAIAAGLAAAASTSLAGSDRADAREKKRGGGAGARMPVVYIPHGGGPWPFVDLGFDRAEMDNLATYLRSLAALPRTAPKAILAVSAHWEEAVPTVMTAAHPPMLYDYYGFPPAAYQLTWPAPGSPALAARVQELLEAGGIASGRDPGRGFDHGTFVPLKLTYPEADLPTVQLSLKHGLDPREHIAVGRALAPLRDEGVFIVGSGMSYHNLREFRSPRAAGVAAQFDGWLNQAATADPRQRDDRLIDWADAPSARAAHPREEHLLPLMVAAGAAGDDRGVAGFVGNVMGARVSAYHFG
ncbi:MAG TPA: class III extradiol ring-cleavage dioxygenase [Polyangia bacterium]|nr:class III extradiol ring-cleavage dioxygenase [Polyangia bacterium]